MMKKTGLYLAKRGSYGINSSSVAKRTNLLPSYSLTHAEGGMGYTESKSDFIFAKLPNLICNEIKKGGLSKATH